MRSAVDRASSHPAVERVVTVATLPIRMCFQTTRLADLFVDSFAIQAQTGPSSPDAGWTVHVTAGDEGTPAPTIVPQEPGGEIMLAASGSTYLLWMGRHAPTLYAVDIAARRALYWTARLEDVPAWERSRPFLPILQVIVDATPWIAIHAGALAHGDGAVLFTGPGRSGKTSLSLAGLGAGWRFIGDDYILLRTDATPEVAPLYATARLRDDMLDQFRQLEPTRREISNDDGDRRHELSLRRANRDLDMTGAPLKSILMLARRGASAPGFGPTSRAAILSTLVANLTAATPGHLTQRAGKLMGLLARFDVRSFDPGPSFGPALAALSGLVA